MSKVGIVSSKIMLIRGTEQRERRTSLPVGERTGLKVSPGPFFFIELFQANFSAVPEVLSITTSNPSIEVNTACNSA